jgi:hypothetical protein
MEVTINISIDIETCGQCGRKGTGYYESKNRPGTYICPECVLENIKRNIKIRHADGKV